MYMNWKLLIVLMAVLAVASCANNATTPAATTATTPATPTTTTPASALKKLGQSIAAIPLGVAEACKNGAEALETVLESFFG